MKNKTSKMSPASHKTEEAAKTLLDLMGVGGEVSGIEEEGVIRLSVSTPTPALVIGYHGKTLDALSAVVSAIAYKKLGEQVRVVVDVDEWRTKREEKLATLAQAVAARVVSSGQEEPIYNLTPAERKIIHLTLGGLPGVVSESRGEGRDRYLVVRPEKSNEVE